jgi:acylphosphatase
MDLYIRFHGSVQGVGFRATARHFASQLHITGTVKNLADGSVEIYAQGQQEQLDAFVDRLQNHFKRYLHRLDMQPIETSKSFSDFDIIF